MSKINLKKFKSIDENTDPEEAAAIAKENMLQLVDVWQVMSEEERLDLINNNEDFKKATWTGSPASSIEQARFLMDTKGWAVVEAEAFQEIQESLSRDGYVFSVRDDGDYQVILKD